MEALPPPFGPLLLASAPGAPCMWPFLVAVGFLILFYTTVKLCFLSSFSARLNRPQQWVLCLVILLAGAMFIYPPWIVQEQILPDEGPPTSMVSTGVFGGFAVQQWGAAPPTYGPPKVSYEPIYMGAYSASRSWFAASAPSGPLFPVAPRPLGRKPKTLDEKAYCKYVCPTRTLELCAGRWGIQFGVLFLFGGVLFWAFTKKGQFSFASQDDAADGVWLVIEPENLRRGPRADSLPGGKSRNP